MSYHCRVSTHHAKKGRIVEEKDYFKDLYNKDTQEQVAVHMFGLNNVQRGNYFGGELIKRTECKVRVGKLENEKAAGKDEVIGEMEKGGGDMVVDWIYRLFKMACENGVVPEDWRAAV